MRNIIIKKEALSDIEQTWEVNSEAFETNAEAELVNRLRNSGVDFISLVAKLDNTIVGHILFTEVTIENSDIKIIGLAPMAVTPKFQNSGIGSVLVKQGIKECIEKGYEAVVVLGHTNYYQKFGFAPSVNFGIESEYDVPEEVFMIKELVENSLLDVSGIVKFHEEFNKL